ncbi:uncharacterized protein LOC111074930 isoform X2 [Drosophila obscura]|uniref:uncharacterized protein LOC111074930 isoform X2 n=1 Tax=Drosophila obscura TaxID=7282 RepID=UPI001BB1A1AB|nr:uncharacterized protein LOC111074930 isoform X2 [Drosophila obscura]
MNPAEKNYVDIPLEELSSTSPKKIAVVVPTKEMQDKQLNEQDKDRQAKQNKVDNDQDEGLQLTDGQDKTDILQDLSESSTDTKPVDTPAKEMQKEHSKGEGSVPAEDRKTLNFEFNDSIPLGLNAQPPEEASPQIPNQIKIVFSLEMMKQIQLEFKKMHSKLKKLRKVDQDDNSQSAKSGCCCNCHRLDKDVGDPSWKPVNGKPQTKEDVQNIKDRQYKGAAFDFWKSCKPKKKVISTLIKSRLAPKLKLSDVRKLIAAPYLQH